MRKINIILKKKQNVNVFTGGFDNDYDGSCSGERFNAHTKVDSILAIIDMEYHSCDYYDITNWHEAISNFENDFSDSCDLGDCTASITIEDCEDED